jgi:phenylpyruvate tautomerase PptA (4-oxalocrotonate tautomerase family)
MTSKLLSEIVLEPEKTTSIFTEFQFPGIYRENGRELIQLVEDYYRFLENDQSQSIHNIRRIYEYRNIDQTLDRMLVFFKTKFLNGLFFDRDIRFIVKNILDLYRSKGSRDGIQLFFRMFFETEAEIYFPSIDMFKPSTSQWKTGTFLQLFPNSDVDQFKNIANLKIFGDKSNASAFVDNVYLILLNGSYIPIIFLSGVKGEFIGFDTIYSLNPKISYGVVYGSLRSVIISPSERITGGNSIGDIVEITSDTGLGAKGRVSDVTRNLSGEVVFSVKDGNYGYTTSNTSIFVSNQNIFFTDNFGLDFEINETIKQTKIDEANNTTDIFATVIGKKRNSIGILVDETETESFESGFEIETINRDTNITRMPTFVTDKNSTARAEIGTIKNKETVTIITDILENFLNVPLNSSNYSLIPPAVIQMSGTRVNGTIPNLNTPLNQAFVPETFDIGEIETLQNINPGMNHITDVFVLARENLLSRFNLKNQILNVSIPAGIALFIGDEIEQQKTIPVFGGPAQLVTVRGRVVDIIGNDVFVKQLTFESFVVGSMVKKGFQPEIIINSTSRDQRSLSLGLNAEISGDVEIVTGRIKEIEVFNSGIGYEEGSRVVIKNITRPEDGNDVDAEGIARTRRQGITEGRWRSFESHLINEKVIQDSDYYQDYSYEITTDIESSLYEEEYRKTMHPVGLKLFSRFGKIEVININVEVFESQIAKITINDTIEMLSEQTENSILSQNGFQYLASLIVEGDDL